MSRGPGHVERAIRELFAAHPDRAFLTADLAKHCFSGADRIERKHEVSVLRAARKIVADNPDWCSWRQEWGSVFYNRASLQSTALFNIVSRQGRLPRPGGKAWEWDWPDGYDWRCWQKPDAARALAVLNHPHCQAHMTPPDGKWWKAVRLHCAQRDGDEAVAVPLRLEAEHKSAALTAELHTFFARRNPAGMLRNSLLPESELLRVAADLHELADGL
jgi:hypothetical protein